MNQSPAFAVDYEVTAALSQEGLKQDDYAEICRRLGRSPNRTELGMFGVMWSEHCCYRNSKPLLQKLPTKGERILVGPGENAGVVDIGDGQKLVFKIESHNHPSALEPFQGAATGVGGILRDIFTMGARPIALLNALRFGPLENKQNIGLLEGVVAGIAHYGNCIGVPTVGGEVAFDNSYTGNPLVNAMALGLMETQEIVCSGAKGIGYPVMYVGSTTGRDGMGGASFASAELTKSSLDDRPAVQVGDPFLEKGLIEACLEAFKSGDVVAAQDMGAAGLTCSCSEMAAKGGLGIELDLDLVPAREKQMTSYEFLLSESQERMLFVIKPGTEEILKHRFTRWGLNVAIVGKVLEENIIRVLRNGEIAAELPASALADDTPIEKHELLSEPPIHIQKHWQWDEKQLPQPYQNGINSLSESFKKNISWNDIVLILLDNPTIASKKWIYSQYDYQVQSNTVLSPGKADAAVVRLRPQEGDESLSSNQRGIAAVVDCPNRWVYLDPERGSIAAVAEASRNLSCVGAEPLAVTDNLNFSSPENSEGYWQLALSCKGIGKACEELNTPVTGGNVSLYNETRNSDDFITPIQPTPVIGMVGLIPDLNNICGMGFIQEGDLIWTLGTSSLNKEDFNEYITLSATTYLESIHGLVTGRPPKINLNAEFLVQSFLREQIHKKHINSAHDITEGGLAIALAECCLATNLGATINLLDTDERTDRILFGEGGGRILITVSSENLASFKSCIQNFNDKNDQCLKSTPIGFVNTTKNLKINQEENNFVDLPVKTLHQTFHNAIPRRVAQ